jgi:hypothetical protein
MRRSYRALKPLLMLSVMSLCLSCRDGDLLPFVATKDLHAGPGYVTSDNLTLELINDSKYVVTGLTFEVVRRRPSESVSYHSSPIEVNATLLPGRSQTFVLPLRGLEYSAWKFRPDRYRPRPGNWNSDFISGTDDPLVMYAIPIVRGHLPP